MAREPVYLLPATDELSALSDATAVKALELIDNANLPWYAVRLAY
jgi:hypothetical protein